MLCFEENRRRQTRKIWMEITPTRRSESKRERRSVPQRKALRHRGQVPCRWPTREEKALEKWLTLSGGETGFRGKLPSIKWGFRFVVSQSVSKEGSIWAAFGLLFRCLKDLTILWRWEGFYGSVLLSWLRWVVGFFVSFASVSSCFLLAVSVS